jgi:hypothetical protein
MNRWLILVVVTLFGMLAGDTRGDIVTPVSAIATSSFAIPPSALIDGSGLNGVGPIQNQRHSNNENAMWIAGIGSQAQNEALEFTLDLNYNLSSAIIWQYNGVNGFGQPTPERGIDEFTILVSPDLASPFVPIGTFNLNAPVDPLDPAGELAQVRAMANATNVRRVKFDINSAHGGPAQEFVGLSEVRFEGTALPPPATRTWNVDSFGSWLQNSNWDPGFAPNANTHNAIFGSAITASRTVVADQSVTAKSITFANTNAYVIAGAGNVNLDADTGSAMLTVTGGAVAGAHQFQAVVDLRDNTTANIGSGAAIAFNHRLNLNGNTLTKTGTGTLSINNLLNSGGGSVVCQEGICNGSGRVGGNLTNSGGTVAPGQSAGILAVEGNFVQASSGTLVAELNGEAVGTSYDQLSVAGTATLAGTLQIVATSQAEPQVRGEQNEFEIVVASVVNGQFNTVTYNGASLAAGANYAGVVNTQDGLFRILETSNSGVSVTNYLAIPGDANGDRVVDGSDFGIWNSNKFTTGTNWSRGDFNRDGVTDGTDFGIWNSNKFTSADASGSLVPEPNSWIVIISLLAAFVRSRK